ncbi:MAG: hypothetical protein FH751_15220 [Firmicutes bacterium]|nr:hypothetical protein [Bacillota bacterium]
MQYIFNVLEIMPVATLFTALIYISIYLILKQKRNKNGNISRLVVEFILIEWCVLFLYVTQVMRFGNGFGDLVNFTPLYLFYIAAKYGLINATMITQFSLNILMFLPLGFLLPIVFLNKFKNHLKILLVSFGISLSTEITQILTGRNADVDDIIANTLGGLIGFSLYIFYKGIYFILRRKKQGKPIGIDRYSIKVIASFSIIIITLSPFIVVKIINTNNEYGYIYYGHLQPINIEISDNITDEETTLKVYKNIQIESLKELQKRLKANTGFTGDFNNTDGCSICKNNKNEAIYIYEYNTWRITFSRDTDIKVEISKLPNEDEAVKLAYEYLKKFQISPDTVRYMGINDNYSNNNLHLEFKSIMITNRVNVWGDIHVEIGEGGRLLSISDYRTYNEFVKEVKTISPRDSIKVAQDIGVGEWTGTAYVTSVEPSYYFNKNTGYLIPTWQITSTFKAKSGRYYSWTPNIKAIK